MIPILLFWRKFLLKLLDDLCLENIGFHDSVGARDFIDQIDQCAISFIDKLITLHFFVCVRARVGWEVFGLTV